MKANVFVHPTLASNTKQLRELELKTGLRSRGSENSNYGVLVPPLRVEAPAYNGKSQ